MATLNVSFPDEMRTWIDEQVKLANLLMLVIIFAI